MASRTRGKCIYRDKFGFLNASTSGARSASLRQATRGVVQQLESRLLLAADVVMSEIMFHPSSEDVGQEYIELYNRGDTAATLTGWHFDKGIDFTFSGGTLGAGQYLVVAANLAKFQAKYPGITNVVGNWTGQLSNSSEQVRLVTSANVTVDSVTYADEGDWAVRRRGEDPIKNSEQLTRVGTVATMKITGHGYATGDIIQITGATQTQYNGTFSITVTSPDTFTYPVAGSPATPATGTIKAQRTDHGHLGWVWQQTADGGGRSLELVNPVLSNDQGQNWLSSNTVQGTPGVANSVASANIAPMILNVAQTPVVPHSTDSVIITAKLTDELTSGLSASVKYRVDSTTPGAFNTVAMHDDGLNGDITAADGIWSAVLPPQANGKVVEFYVSATDAGAHTRTWPGPTDASGTQGANLLYAVDDSTYSGTQPINRLIMTENERLELVDIGNGGGFIDQLSNAEMNGTFINSDATGVSVRYTVGIRNRGHGSRLGPPNNYHVDFPSDHPSKGVTSTNFNSRTIHSQVIGAAIYQLSGLPGFDGAAVQVRVNNANLATGIDGMFGSYAQVEQPDSDWASHHFGGDGNGNYYSVYRTDDAVSIEGDLRYEGTDPNTYRNRYFKETNKSEDDWSDLIHMLDVLNNTPDQSYLQAVGQVINVNEWVHYLALDSLLLNWETGLDRGIGDDFALYSGVTDNRFSLVPHDLDTVLNQGNGAAPINTSIFNFTGVDGLNKFLNNPQILPLYYQAFLDQINTFFNSQTLNPLMDEMLGSFVPAANITAMKQFVVDRTAAVLAQIPRTYQINNILPVLNGYPRSTTPDVPLSGTADVTKTRSVLINGQPAVWDGKAGTWTVGSGGGTQVLVKAGVQGTQGSPGVPGAAGDTWRYLANGSNQGSAWTATGFNDSAAPWASGSSQLGYGDGDENTVVPSGPLGAHYITTYFRRQFNISDKTQVTGLTLNLLRDDGAVVYLNGNPIVKSNMPDTIDYLTHASTGVSGTAESSFTTYSIDPANLVDGVNQLAVEIHQVDATTSTDISFDLGLVATLKSTSPGIHLTAGVNRVTMRAFDGLNGTGDEVGRAITDIWYDGSGAAVSTPANVSNLNLLLPDTYRPGTPLLIEASALDALGKVQKELWDGTVTLSTGRSDLTLTPNTITLRNGLGSALVTVGGAAAGTAPLAVTATLGTHQTTATLTSRAGVAMTNVSGVLSGAAVSWSGIIHVTSTVTVPVGTTLTIQPGTLVLIDGTATLLSENAAGITVNGTLNSMGTAAQPVVITATNPAAPWGEINHSSAQPSQYHYTMITRAGHSPRGGHTNTGPAVRSTSSTITFDHSSISDLVGKTMQVDLSNITFTDSHLARAVMGPELDRSGMLFQDSWSTEMLGIYREDGINDDDDSMYVHRQQAGQQIQFIRSVFARADDDGIDTLSPDFTVDGTIIRDIFDKGISIIQGVNVIRNTLMSNVDIGISAKAFDNPNSNNTLDHVTINANSIAIQSENKYGVPNAVINFNIKNSVLRATEGVRTDYASSQIVINYSDISPSQTWTQAGTGNTNADPLFVNKAAGDLHPRGGSPVINAGDPASTNDPDGSRADMGYYLNGIPGTSAAQTIGTSSLPAGTTVMDGGNSAYHITGIITVPAGAILRIMPGTTLFFDPGAGIMFSGGQLLAEGTQAAQIRFSRFPGSASASRWNGLQFSGSMADNRLTYCVLEWGGDATTNAGMVGLDASNLTIDHCFFDHADHRRIRTRDSSLIVQDSTFTDIFGPGEVPTTDNFSEQIWGGGIPANGHFIIRRNSFGTSKGHNDIIDFDPPVRPNPIAQIIDNTFYGGGDDALDLEGDAHIEGNTFQNFLKDQYNTGTGNSNGISAGAAHNYVMVRNLFRNMEHIAQVKDGSFLTFINNTVIGASLPAIYFLRPAQPGSEGRGAYLDGNIFSGVANTFGDVIASTDLVVNRSIVNPADVGLGVGNIVGDPRFVSASTGDAHLRPGSPAIGTGPNGVDMGAMIPVGASISGGPPASTASTSATFVVSGPSITAYKYKLNNGVYSAETPIGTPITLSNLTNGTYTVYVLGKNDAGTWQDDASVYSGAVGPTASRSWTVNTAPPTLRINEILASNVSAVNDSGQFPDMLELFNDGTASIDLSGMSITDDQASHTKFIFPAGTTIGAGQYKLLYLDGRTIAGETHIGAFGLKQSGEGVYLYNTAPSGGGLIDGVTFGLQLNDLSIGRLASGAWGLTKPTFGSANQAQQTGDPSKLRINEWLTQPTAQFLEDFVEIYNPDTLPVSIGGFYFSDNPATEPTKSQVPLLSFLPAASYTEFVADGNTGNGADHLSFGLASEQGLIGLLDNNQTLIDRVIYEPQRAGFSEGRTPDGGTTYQFFSPPTPGITNGGAPVSTLPLRITEIMYNPAAPTAGSIYNPSDYEYIEVKNTSGSPINLANVELADGVSFAFPNVQLAAGAFGLVVSNQAAFQERYGTSLPVMGQYGGDLSTEGERIRLEDAANATILDFAYDDAWYPSTDGTGFSLVKIDPNGAASGWGVSTNWQPSNRLLGSPGTAEPPADSTAPTVDINDVAPDPRNTPVSSITITFNEPVFGFDLADLSLTLGAGTNLLGPTQTLSTADNRIWTLGNLGDVTTAAGTYTLALTASGSGISDLSNNPLTTNASDSWQVTAAAPQVVGRFLFYNNSKWDTVTDDAAIATDTQALFPNGTATFSNYSNYSRGINGLMIDISGLPAGNGLTVGNFEFRTGQNTTGGDPGTAWGLVAAAPTMTVRRGAGVNGSDRITFIWTDAQSVKNAWMRVKINTGAATGLTTADVFYFGNAIGESGTGNDANTAPVDARDYFATRDHLRSYDNLAPVTYAFDYNRDGVVDGADLLIIRANPTSGATALQLIHPPAPLQAAPAPKLVTTTTTTTTSRSLFSVARVRSFTRASTTTVAPASSSVLTTRRAGLVKSV